MADNESSLTPYRALDLTEGGYNWCGRLLADLGADVIKIEPFGGSPTRMRGPFYGDDRHLERSLFWFAYCMNKRGITLDIESVEGREQFKALAASADFVLESFAPGYMESLGLGYESLSRVNPGIIVTSMTPFGQTGPYADYKATDIVSWSMGGMQYITGDADRPPVRISFPQAELHAGAQGAAASMIALWHRQRTGEGQHVDVSVQTAVIWTLMNATPFPHLHKENLERNGAYRSQARANAGAVSIRMVYHCKDGFVSFLFGGGKGARLSLAPVSRWMEEEGVAPDFMKGRDWNKWDIQELLAQGEEGAREVQAVADEVERFIATKTKAALYERAIRNKILIAPCNTVEDIWDDPQLKARNYWVELEHPELGASITYLGPYIKLGETPIKQSRRAPLVGEHNETILGETRRESEKTHVEHPKGVAGNSSVMALEGLKVLDFTWVGVGPITIKYLADHGADVVRVESVTRPDTLRGAPPFKDAVPGINRSQFSASYNASKYGLGVNMSSLEAQALIRRIIKDWQPDVIAESFTPGVMARWGLDYEGVKKIKPDIIYFSTCQQGQTGPRASYAGFGQLAASLAGFYHITGWPDHDPSPPYGAYSDFINPPNAFTAIMAALEYRRRTGKGQHLDLSQYECAMQFLAPAIMDYIISGRVISRRGNEDDSHAPHGVYRCKDEERSLTGIGESWCAIAVTTDQEWQALCKAIGSPDLARDARFETFATRKENREELDRLLGEWTSQREAHEAMRVLQEAGVPAGAVQSQADLWEDPQLKHREFFQWLNHTECGPMPYDGLQFILSKTPGKLHRPHALIGEHNELILKDFIGLSDDEIADLIASEVLETS